MMRLLTSYGYDAVPFANGQALLEATLGKYFADAKFSEAHRPLFAFASYQCGPGNASKMRKEAVKRGLDPDKWFNNVEIVTAGRIGTESTTYVRNIHKYYVACKLMHDAHETAAKARGQVKTINRRKIT